MNILEEIIAAKRQEVATARTLRPEAVIRAAAEACNRPVHSLREALAASPGGIIAEFKRRSPSKGFIHPGARIEEIVPGYAAAGATALSVLTDNPYFGGSADDLLHARRRTSLPLLRKDFVVDEFQICEARIWGADAVLLIAAVLSPDETLRLARYAHALGLEVLLELHGEDELCCLNKYVDVVGVNNRDLKTFRTDPARSFELVKQLPADAVKISESGLSDPETVRALRAAGFDGFLMGETFMKEADPAQALARFVAEL